ncbi:glycosyl hydrolase family 95 catalytic domain-containing protein [Alkalihalobacillus trypoxylicola]|uniref:glycosyl hydrolase family 95 catalytic domain-containing protein n=1 Tax=Alkalihalobacillus trypoxylicola TaxID=519424 RepID=UPI000AF2128E|nr:glycoside hydrolase N-terminal domain-containing protein [Alkalihalobacillus trypoxylicola]
MKKENHSRYQLHLNYPASWWKNMWREALPSGNGKIGAAVYGGIKNETILINHQDLWHMGVKDNLPDVSQHLQKTRELMETKKYREASRVLSNTLKEKNYQSQLSSLLPLADFKVEMPVAQAFKKYNRKLNMETGEVTVSWNEEDYNMVRKLFVSRADDLIVYEIESTKPLDWIHFKLSLHSTDQPKMEQRIRELEEHSKSKAADYFLYFSAKNDDQTDFGVVAKVIPSEGELLVKNQSITCKNVKKVRILMKVFVQSNSTFMWGKLEKELRQCTATYQELLTRHLPLHQELFHCADFRLETEDSSCSNEELLMSAYQGEASPQLIEKLWHFGRYLFISGTSEEGTQPFGMYGLWAGDYQLMWGHRMANENIQMMYWHAGVGGLSRLVPVMFDYYERMLGDFRLNAQHLYGCRGIYIPAGTTPEIGLPSQIVPVILNWTGAAAWLSQTFYEYYLYTKDQHFLEHKLLPFMKEVAHFYEDFLVELHGETSIYPSISPENTPYNYMPEAGESLAHPMPTTINATMDIALIKELLQHLIEACEESQLFLNEINKWKEMIQTLPPYKVNKEGAIKEWAHNDFQDRYEHRHLSHLYPLFPGKEMANSTDEEQLAPFRKAVSLREIEAQTGWSFAHMASIYARLGEGTSALEQIDRLTQSCLLTNLYTVHNDWRSMGLSMEIETAPVQMDANLGIVGAIQEMLLFVSQKQVRLLPAVPYRWKKGEVKNFRFHSGIVSFQWDLQKKSFKARLKAISNTNITLLLPSFIKEQKILIIAADKEQNVLSSSEITVQLEANQALSIKSIER